MATIKVKFRKSSVPGECGVIYYQIIHNRVIRQMSTDYRIETEEWDDRHSVVVTSANSTRRDFILSIRERIRWDLERLRKIVRKLDDGVVEYSADDVICEFRRFAGEYTFFNYMESNIARLKQMGKSGTSSNYRSALNSFKKFRDNEDIMLDLLTSEIMEKYEAWQKGRGVIPNTISFYLRIFRAVYRRAVDDGIVEDRKPFRRVYTGVEKTVKRALSLTQIRRVKSLDLSLKPKLEHARDMFLLSFYFRGMSLIDMAFLRKSDLCDGELSYRRRKTNQKLHIAWTKEMQTIIDKYPGNESLYLLPILSGKDSDEHAAYKNAGDRLNRRLKQIGRLVGAVDFKHWSFYRARHSWASIAKSKGVPVSVISEGMGHDSETTTLIYLASLDTSTVDKANELIISSL